MKNKRSALSAFLALLVVSGAVEGGPVLAQGTDTLNITQYQLDNGLQIILVEDHSAPTVAISVWYRVGGANDPQGRSGFAHLFEHMLFQGSENVPPGAHAELIHAAGGDDNASTSIDRTNYFETLPSHQLPLALWLEADRMRSLIVDSDNFDREREVVKEEYRQRIENQPYGEASLRLQTMAFDYPPYQKPVIGSIEDLDRATVDQVRSFHDAYYKPNNATMTIAGDIEPDQVRALVDRYFADITRRDAAPALPPYEFSLQDLPQELIIQDPLARVPAAFIIYRVPSRGEPDFYAASLLARILGSGDSSRLARALVDPGLASDTSSAVMGNLGPSMLYASLTPNPGVKLEQLENIYYEQLDRIRRDGVDPDELQKAINVIRTSRMRSLQSALGLAESVQAANFYLGDPQAVFLELERYREVTPEDIKRVAAEYLSSERRNVVKVLPAAEAAVLPTPQMPEVVPAGVVTATTEVDATAVLSATAVAEPVAPAAAPLPDRGAALEEHPATAPITSTLVGAPTPLPVRQMKLPEMSETRLDNGLQVVVIPLRGLPLLTLRLVLPGGNSAEPEKLTGLASIAAELLQRGTTTRDAQEIAGTIEQVGGDLSTDAGDDQLSISISVLSEYRDLAFDLLGDVSLNPTFPQSELDMSIQRALADLEATLAEPTDVASRALDAIVYGPHPYGRNETEASLTGIARDDVVAFYDAQKTPRGALLIVAGDIGGDEAVQQARLAFGQWTGPERDGQTFAEPPARTERVIYLVDRPGSTQADVLIGQLGLPGNSPARFAAQVANQVLGGGSTSRLFKNLREQKGYTYGVGSGFTLPRDRGKFLVQGAVRNQVAGPAINEILVEVERLRTTLVPAGELNDAKSYLLGSFALRLETATELIGQVASLKLRGLPLNSLEMYPQEIERIDQATVERTATELLHPNQVAIVVVGDAAAIRPGLERIGRVVAINSEGQPAR